MLLERGQVAVITGAASGIGKAIARELAGRGLAIASLDIDEVGLDEACHEFRNSRVAASPSRWTSATPRPPRLAEAVREEFGRLDIVGNNAGVLTARSVTWPDDVDAEHPSDFLVRDVKRPASLCAHIGRRRLRARPAHGLQYRPGQLCRARAVRRATKHAWSDLRLR